MSKHRSGYVLRPERRQEIERQRQFVSALDEADPDAAQGALAALNPDVLTDDDIEQDEFHLAREYRRRQ